MRSCSVSSVSGERDSIPDLLYPALGIVDRLQEFVNKMKGDFSPVSDPVNIVPGLFNAIQGMFNPMSGCAHPMQGLSLLTPGLLNPVSGPANIVPGLINTMPGLVNGVPSQRNPSSS